MADREVGIIIRARDNASAVLEHIGDEGKRSFRDLKDSIRTAHDALEVIERAYVKIKVASQEFVRASIEGRNENDQQRKAFEELTKQADIFSARLGDVLLPIVQGVGEAFFGAAGGVNNYLQENRKVIASGLLEFLADTARIVSSVITPAVFLAADAVSGWVQIWDVLKIASLESLSAVASALSFVSDNAKANGAAFRAASEEAKDALGKHQIQQEEMREKIVAFGGDVDKFITEAQKRASDAIDTSTASMHRQVGKLSELKQGFAQWSAEFGAGIETALETDAMSSRMAAIDKMSKHNINKIETEAKAFEEAAKRKDKDMEDSAKRQIELDREIGSTAASIATDLTGIWAEVVQGQMSASDAMEMSVISAARTTIQAAAAAMAAQQMLATGGMIPGIGILVGGAAAAAALGAVQAYMSEVPKAAMGGSIRGGVPGVDSVGVLVQSGEGILRGGQTALIQRLADSLDRMSARGMQPAMAGGGTTVNLQTLGPIVSADTVRALKDFARLQKRGGRRL